MKTLCKFAISAVAALLPASIALGQQEYIGHYDVYTAYMYLSSPLINLGESGFMTQIGTNPTKWYSMGFDFSEGTGDTVLLPNMLKSSLQQQIAAQFAAGGIPSTYHLAVPMHSRSLTYALGPQLNYRRFRKVTLFAHPDLGAIHETAIPHALDPVGRLLVAQLAPSGIKEDWVYFYGFGGGMEFNATRHLGLKVHVDFVRDHLFSDLLNARNTVRFSVGPSFHFGKNMAAAK